MTDAVGGSPGGPIEQPPDGSPGGESESGGPPGLSPDSWDGGGLPRLPLVGGRLLSRPFIRTVAARCEESGLASAHRNCELRLECKS